MKLTIKEEFNNEVYRDLEEQLIEDFYKLDTDELLKYYDSSIETGGGAVWILPDGKTIELDLHSDFGSETFYRFCRAYFKEHSEYAGDYDEDDFALEDCNEFNDHLSYALGWAKFNTGTFYDDRYYLVPPRSRMTNNQFITLECILEETSEDVGSLLVIPWLTSSITYYFSKHTPRSIIKSLQKFYTSGILEESTERSDDMLFTDSPYTIRDYCINRPDAYRILYDKNIDLYMLCNANDYIHFDLITKAFNLGYYSNLDDAEHIDPLIRDYLKDRDFYNYTDIGVDGFYDGDEGLVELGQYLMYAIWVPNGMDESEIDYSPSSDGYDDEFEFPAGSLFTRDLGMDLMNDCKLIDLLRKAKPSTLQESVSIDKASLLDFMYSNLPLQNEMYYWSTFIMPDGRFVNISKIDTGDDFNSAEHEEVYNYIHKHNNEMYVDDREIVNELGCIKLNITYPYIALSDNVRPTTAQYKSLRNWIDNASSDFDYEIRGCEDTGSVKYPIAVDKWSNYKIYDLEIMDSDDIIKAIQKSYSSGILESALANSLLNKITTAWCKETAHPAYQNNWSKDNSSAGQCLVTALVVQDVLGGDIYDCKVGRARHFYNVVNGETIDLTFKQFPDGSEITDSCIRDRKQLLSNKDTRQRYNLLKSKIGDNKSMAESIKPNKDSVDLEYCDLPITIQSAMDWDGDYSEKEITKDFTYRVDKDDIIAVLIEDFIDNTDIADIDNASDEDIETFVQNNFEALLEKYYEKILDKFEDNAIAACENDYGWDDYQRDEADAYADYLYDTYRDSQFDESASTSRKLTIKEDWNNTDTEFIDYVLDTFKEFLNSWPVNPYSRDAEIADTDTLISRFLTKGLTDEKVQQVIDEMEYYLDYSGVELDDVDLNKGSIWDWTDKYTHYLIVEQNFAAVLDGVGYDKAKELVKSWKPAIKTEAVSKETTTWAVVNTEPRKGKENLIPVKVEGKITPITFRGWAYGERQHEYSTGSIRATFETENEAMNYIKIIQK